MGELDPKMLAFLIGNVIGFILKNNTGFNNKFIPVAVLGWNIFLQFLLGIGIDPETWVPPAPPPPDSTLTYAGLWGFLGPILRAGLVTCLNVGLHSAVKNLKQGVKELPPR